MRKKILLIVAAITLAVTSLFTGSSPANASTIICNPDTANQTFSVGSVVTKSGCVQIVAVMDWNAGTYWWSVGAQDVNEVPLVPWFSSDDGGITQIQFQTPGDGVWHDWAYDINSADYNIAYGSSAVYNSIINGPPEAWHWRIKGTVHYRCNNFIACGSTSWKTSTSYTGSFVVFA